MNKKLEGKVAVITGGTSGIGFAAAKLFHREGARVVVTGQNPATVERARVELAGVAEVVRSDASDPAQIRDLFERVERDYGALDVLFLNAGIVRMGDLTTVDEADFDESFRVNVKGPWLALRAAVPRMRRGSTIVFNTSITGLRASFSAAAYGASKAALSSIARTAAAELADRGIRVNAVCPGPTDSGIIEKSGLSAEVTTATKDALVARIPQHRLAAPEEIARVALFLASDDSSFLTGEEIVVDGGLTRI
ncbi:3-oxoacyl-[acyl-carrier protein] reductase [Minicystis rosea]|nr:3-oxoacyl-[acyl-carrier protein] reductase [Minicystis rosea]